MHLRSIQSLYRVKVAQVPLRVRALIPSGRMLAKPRPVARAVGAARLLASQRVTHFPPPPCPPAAKPPAHCDRIIPQFCQLPLILEESWRPSVEPRTSIPRTPSPSGAIRVSSWSHFSLPVGSQIGLLSISSRISFFLSPGDEIEDERVGYPRDGGP